MKRLLLLVILIGALLVVLRLLWKRIASSPVRASLPTDPATGRLLLLLPLPAALAALVSMVEGRLTPFLGDAVGYGLLLGGAIMLRRGLRAAAGDRAVRYPFKLIGSSLVALGTGTVAWLGVGHDLGIAVAFSATALLGCHLVYGFEVPVRHPRLESGSSSPRAREALAEASRSLDAIERAARDIRQPELAERLRRIGTLAREILTRLDEDPRDLPRARTFLNVYLEGTQRVVEGYAKTHDKVSAPALDERFRRVLLLIEDEFRQQQLKLLESDLDTLDLQIEVLTQQLKSEGIA